METLLEYRMKCRRRNVSIESNVTILAVALSCFVGSLATNYSPKGGPSGPGYGPKGSPLEDDEPIILHTNKPLLITKTISDLPQEALKALSHVGRAHSKLLKLHELRDFEYGKGRVLDSHGPLERGPAPHFDGPIPARFGPSKALLTQPIVLDNAHRHLHDLRYDVIHDEKLLDLHAYAKPVFAPALPIKAFLPGLNGGHGFAGGHGYGHGPIILQEKRLVRPVIAPFQPIPASHPTPVKYLKPGY